MKPDMPAWVESFSGAVTVADTEWKILYMNEKASEVFAKRGGREVLVGGNLMACHPEGARAKLRELLASGRTTPTPSRRAASTSSSTRRLGTLKGR